MHNIVYSVEAILKWDVANSRSMRRFGQEGHADTPLWIARISRRDSEIKGIDNCNCI